MEIIFYTLISIIGILFGSFYTLAIYRIPKKQDITHTHSYCPKCQHKLGFWDLIPLFSYIFLGGKCRYCKEKIRPRYFIIELISGIFFLLIAYLWNFDLENLQVLKLIDFCFFILYFTFIVLMAGIDKESKIIDKKVTAYGIIISILYMIYLYIVDETNIYRYAMYLLVYIIILIIDNITLRKYAKDKYTNGIILTTIIMAIFSGELCTYMAITLVLLTFAICILCKKIYNKKNHILKENIGPKLPIGFMLAVADIIIFIYILLCNKFLI